MKKYWFCLLLCFTYVSVVIMTATMADARTLKMYAPYVEESYITQGLVSAINQIKEETNGKISIKLFPDINFLYHLVNVFARWKRQRERFH